MTGNCSGQGDGIYQTSLSGLGQSKAVLCQDNWLLLTRRQDGSENFYRDWNDYRDGFGNLTGEFWMGLEALHQISSSGSWTLRVDMCDWVSNCTYATYSNFSVDSEALNYALHVDYIGGTVLDSLERKHDGFAFTTKDRDNDVNDVDNCAVKFQGAWWFASCCHSHLFGVYTASGSSPNKTGVRWREFHGATYSLKSAEMKIQPSSP